MQDGKSYSVLYILNILLKLPEVALKLENQHYYIKWRKKKSIIFTRI